MYSMENVREECYTPFRHLNRFQLLFGIGRKGTDPVGKRRCFDVDVTSEKDVVWMLSVGLE